MLSVLLVSTLFSFGPVQASECQPSGMGWIQAFANALGFESSDSVSVYELIAQKNYASAKQAAHEIAQQARADNNPATVEVAGYVWQVADKLESAEAALAAGEYEAAKTMASRAADIVRDLLEQGLIDQAEADRILKRAGEIWTEAHEALKESEWCGPDSGSARL